MDFLELTSGLSHNAYLSVIGRELGRIGMVYRSASSNESDSPENVNVIVRPFGMEIFHMTCPGEDVLAVKSDVNVVMERESSSMK